MEGEPPPLKRQRKTYHNANINSGSSSSSSCRTSVDDFWGQLTSPEATVQQVSQMLLGAMLVRELSEDHLHDG